MKAQGIGMDGVMRKFAIHDSQLTIVGEIPVRNFLYFKVW